MKAKESMKSKITARIFYFIITFPQKITMIAREAAQCDNKVMIKLIRLLLSWNKLYPLQILVIVGNLLSSTCRIDRNRGSQTRVRSHVVWNISLSRAEIHAPRNVIKYSSRLYNFSTELNVVQSMIQKSVLGTRLHDCLFSVPLSFELFSVRV